MEIPRYGMMGIIIKQEDIIMNINIDKKAESYIKAKSNDLSIHLGIKRVGSG